MRECRVCGMVNFFDFCNDPLFFLFLSYYRYLNYSLEIIALLQRHGITPVMVFDGNKLEAKTSVHENPAW